MRGLRFTKLTKTFDFISKEEKSCRNWVNEIVLERNFEFDRNKLVTR